MREEKGRLQYAAPGSAALRFSLTATLIAGACAAATLFMTAAPAHAGPPQLSLGTYYSCFKLPADTVKCWGRNNDGQLGNGTTTSGPTANFVKKSIGPSQYNATYSQINAGEATTCGVATSASGYQTDGVLECWGSNYWGELGLGGPSPTSPPPSGQSAFRVSPASSLVTGATAVGGASKTNCAIVAAGAVKCFGSNIEGQLGSGSTPTSDAYPLPETVSALTGASELSSTSQGKFMCALISGGVKCWGQNTAGQLGNNATSATQSTPVSVVAEGNPSSLLADVTQVSTGTIHACALINDGTVKCWGSNNSGALGIGSASPATSTTPVTVPGLSGVTQVTSGSGFSCALLTDKTVKCWGTGNLGQMGNGTTLPSNFSPVAVSGLTGVTQIAAGVQHSCALTETQEIKCWGSNFYGELGVPGGSGTFSSTPILVPWTQAVEYQLTVTKSGSGSGTVTGPGISCGATCTASKAQGSTVTLVATADSGSEFDGWTGDCSGVTTDCTVTMSQARTVNAVFKTVNTPERLTVTKSGSGTGTVDGDGILCGSICEVFREKGSTVTLIAKADPGSAFLGWSGPCSGPQTTCRLTMDGSRTVNAEFAKGGSNEFEFRPTPGGPSSRDVESLVTVPGSGSIRQSATRKTGGRSVAACKGAVRVVRRAGTYRLSCRQSAATLAARRKGPVRVSVCVTYTPAGGEASRKCRNVTLRSLKRPSFTG